MNFAVIGCGVISGRYLQNAPMFRGVKIVACADLRPEAARKQAKAHGIKALSVAAALKSDAIDGIINLTVPNAHFAVSRRALTAGKHVFSEKPLSVLPREGRALVELADKHKVGLGVAPDTFLGPGQRYARSLIEGGQTGRIVAASAFLMSRGMEHWHPDPTFFFKPGGGPVLDMGPYYLTALINMIGPVRDVMALDGMGLAERVITAEGPKKGQSIKVETPTTSLATLRFANGALATLALSWDVFQHGHRPLELYGTEGSLRVPDPNFFGGDVEFAAAREAWSLTNTAGQLTGKPNHPDINPQHANYRMLGVAELADAVRHKRQPRASGALGLHVLDVMDAILRSGRTRKLVSVSGGAQPAAFSEAEVAKLLIDPQATRS